MIAINKKIYISISSCLEVLEMEYHKIKCKMTDCLVFVQKYKMLGRMYFVAFCL